MVRPGSSASFPPRGVGTSWGHRGQRNQVLPGSELLRLWLSTPWPISLMGIAVVGDLGEDGFHAGVVFEEGAPVVGTGRG